MNYNSMVILLNYIYLQKFNAIVIFGKIKI